MFSSFGARRESAMAVFKKAYNKLEDLVNDVAEAKEKQRGIERKAIEEQQLLDIEYQAAIKCMDNIKKVLE